MGPDSHQQHPHRINGCDDYHVTVRRRIPIEECSFLRRGDDSSAAKTILHFNEFYPGCVIAIRVSLASSAQAAVVRLRSLLTGLSLPIRTPTSPSGAVANWEDLERAVHSMTLADLNVALYRCHQEEVEDGRPGVYVIPEFGPLIYCGLQGVMSLLSDIRPNNDLGHPLCANLRDGDWLAGYLSGRLQQYEATAALGRWLETALSSLGELPRYLVPCYFDAVVTGTYLVLLGRSWSLMSR